MRKSTETAAGQDQSEQGYGAGDMTQGAAAGRMPGVDISDAKSAGQMPAGDMTEGAATGRMPGVEISDAKVATRMPAGDMTEGAAAGRMPGVTYP